MILNYILLEISFKINLKNQNRITLTILAPATMATMIRERKRKFK